MRHDLGDLPELLDDEDHQYVARIVDFRADLDASELTFLLRLSDLSGSCTDRRVHCSGAVRWNLTDGRVDWLLVREEHPGLEPFGPTGALYFRGVPSDGRQMLLELRAVHDRATEGYLDFREIVNTGWGAGDGSEVFRMGHGQLAEGPVSLLREYANVARAHHLKTNILETGPQKRLDPVTERWVPFPSGLRLLDMGESYVVATDIHAA